MKKIAVTFLMAFLSSVGFCQHHARVQLQMGNWSSPTDRRGITFAKPVVNTVGLSLNHKLYKGLSIKLNYSRWQLLPSSVPKTYIFVDKTFPHNNPLQAGAIGKTAFREDYNMLELSAQYAIAIRKNKLYASIGVSNAFGKDIYLVSAYQFEPGYDLLEEYGTKKGSYTGIVWELGYNYLLNHGRFNVGPSVSGQYYTSNFSVYNLRLNFGYNFDVIHKRSKDK